MNFTFIEAALRLFATGLWNFLKIVGSLFAILFVIFAGGSVFQYLGVDKFDDAIGAFVMTIILVPMALFMVAAFTLDFFQDVKKKEKELRAKRSNEELLGGLTEAVASGDLELVDVEEESNERLRRPLSKRDS